MITKYSVVRKTKNGQNEVIGVYDKYIEADMVATDLARDGDNVKIKVVERSYK